MVVLADKLDKAASDIQRYRGTLDPKDHFLGDQWLGAANVLEGLSADLRAGREPLETMLSEIRKPEGFAAFDSLMKNLVKIPSKANLK